MKIIEHIEDLNLQTDDINCQNEAKKLYKKLNTLGKLFFFGGIFITILFLIALIAISIYAIISENMIYWHMLFIIGIFIFAILAIIGKFMLSLSKMIEIKK